jgi:hypothetical protein
MKMFIWMSAEMVSSRYHSDGGLMVIASTEERARELANGTEDVVVSPGNTVDHVYELLGAPEEKVLVFPDAGCC